MQNTLPNLPPEQNQRAEERTKKRTCLLLLALLLFLLVILTLAILGSRFDFFYAYKTQLNIDLLEKGITTPIRVPSGDANESATDPIIDSVLEDSWYTAHPGLYVSDEQAVWTTDSQVEIFHVRYDNAKGSFTVVGSEDSEVVAPGTSHEYRFKISNTGDVSMSYSLLTEAYFGNSEVMIPLEVKLSDYSGKYLVGDENTWMPFEDLNDVADSGILSSYHCEIYILEWQWPFETDDEYDTYLGNLACEEDLTLTVVIHTIAAENNDPNARGGILDPLDSWSFVNPDTGDRAEGLRWGLLALVCLGLLILLLRRKVRQKKQDNLKEVPHAPA